ncbi:MAG TPA: MarR family transcriptional regulator [Chloroflexia bacterium]|nr:MarR family transcriptional regulator [Chloroflexia bacterium]
MSNEKDKKLDEFHLAAWRSFLNAHASVIELIEREMASAHQLPLSSYDVLVALSEAPDRRLRMHELASRVVLSRSGLTRLVDRLEEQGMLARERITTDRRGASAILTEKGLATLRAAWPVYAGGIKQYFTDLLSDEEVTVLTGALSRIDAKARENLT